jgi:hypothetical protein
LDPIPQRVSKVRKTNIKYTGAARDLLGVSEFPETAIWYLRETTLHLAVIKGKESGSEERQHLLVNSPA